MKNTTNMRLNITGQAAAVLGGAAAVVILVLSHPLAARAQDADLRFDAASVRPNRDACRGRWDIVALHGAVTAVNAPLLRIISRAFESTDDRVAGPKWLESECYDIKAKASKSVLTDHDLMLMLQNLLKERFHLVAHVEGGERPVFALIRDSGGVKMPSDGAQVVVPPFTNDGRALFMAKTLHDLRERLGKVTGRPVIDKTGLTGKYTIVLSYLPLGVTNEDASDPAADIFSAVRDQLGLRLVPERGVVDILRIDSIAKIPTAN